MSPYFRAFLWLPVRELFKSVSWDTCKIFLVQLRPSSLSPLACLLPRQPLSAMILLCPSFCHSPPPLYLPCQPLALPSPRFLSPSFRCFPHCHFLSSLPCLGLTGSNIRNWNGSVETRTLKESISHEFTERHGTHKTPDMEEEPPEGPQKKTKMNIPPPVCPHWYILA